MAQLDLDHHRELCWRKPQPSRSPDLVFRRTCKCLLLCDLLCSSFGLAIIGRRGWPLPFRSHTGGGHLSGRMCHSDADEVWKSGEIIPQNTTLVWLPQCFFPLSVCTKESFSTTSAYHCFPGAPVTMPALKAEKQLAFLCKGPLRGEIMLFPKVRVHCCWVAAKSGLPIRSGGDNNAHVCHFLTSWKLQD